jgi:Ca-activated chloride channel family protein
MNARQDCSTEREERYHEAVASYLGALDAGGNPDRREWLERYPEVAPQLEAFFADHDRMNEAARSPGSDVRRREGRTGLAQTLPLLTDEEVGRCLPVEEEPGFGSLATDKGHLPLAAMQVNAQIEGLLAHLTVCQTFVNTLDEPIEATYIFPLPDRMAVTQFRMEVGGREVEGVLKERAAARQDYSAALQQGHQAAITEEERPGVFTLRVGNLPPGEEAAVQLSLVGPIPYSNGEATFRFPLVVAPRYVPGKPLPVPAVGAGTARDTDAAPDASRVTPPTLLPGYPNPVRLALAVDVYPSGIPMRDFRSSLHAVLQAEDGDGVLRILLQAGERLNRDFILRFRVGEAAVRTALALLPDAGGKEGTFALTLVPPEGALLVQRPREVVFILDRSGSMQGWKLVAARRALSRMVDTLGEQDRFTVYAFADRIETPPQLAGTQLVLASHRNRYWAVEFLNRIEAHGGTEMYQPLDLAAHVLSGGEAGRERILVLVTDGQVANENQILRGLGERARHLRLFALGIDRAVNEGFLRQLAGLGKGAYELVESEERLEEVTEDIHRRIGNPVLTGPRLEADGFELIPDSLVPRRLPDLFSGAALCVWGRYRGAPRGALVVQARDGEGKPWFATVPARRSHNPAIAPLWARGRVRELEDQFAVAQTGRDQIEKQLLETSLRFDVLCRFTSFVAVDRAKVVNPGGRVKCITQAVEMPEGWATTEVSLLDQILDATKPVDKSEQAHTKTYLEEFVKKASEGQLVSKEVEDNIKHWIGEIDKKLSTQLNEVMHHPDLQKLEATWRGLKYLVDQTDTGPQLKIRVLNATKKDLLQDHKRANDFDQSQLFKMVYEAEFGMLGGHPYGMLVGDYEFNHGSEDMALLKHMSKIAAAAHAPFVAAASPKTFRMDRFTELPNPRDLSMIFEGVEYATWKSFRDSEDSRYVALTMPRVLGRLPYGPEFTPVERFNFEESVDGKNHDKYLWMNAAWAYAAGVTDAFAQHGSFAARQKLEEIRDSLILLWSKIPGNAILEQLLADILANTDQAVPQATEVRVAPPVPGARAVPSDESLRSAMPGRRRLRGNLRAVPSDETPVSSRVQQAQPKSLARRASGFWFWLILLALALGGILWYIWR